MESLAKKLGIRVEPLGKRGEVRMVFPAKEGVEEFYLRLSKRKALELLLWIFFNKKNNKGVKND